MGDEQGCFRTRRLRDRVAVGDPGALGEAVDLLYRPLVEHLSARGRFRGVDPQMVEDAVLDALWEYVAGPQTSSPPGDRPLARQLGLAAERNVLNALRGESRRKRRERAAAKPEHSDVELHSPAGIAIQNEEAERRQRERQRLMELLPDPTDRRVLELMLDGERRTAAFAAVLGLGHLPAAGRRREVKRVKDRINKVIRRAIRRENPGPDAADGPAEDAGPD